MSGSTYSGPKRKRATLQTPVDTADALGQPIPSWSDVGEYWVEVRSMTGREALNAQQLKATSNHVLVSRWLGFTPTPLQRWVYRGRVFNIDAVLNTQEQDYEFTYFCTEVVEPPTAP